MKTVEKINMLLIEEKSLFEVYQLFILSDLKTNQRYWTIKILLTEMNIYIFRYNKKLIEILNEEHIRNPYFPKWELERKN